MRAIVTTAFKGCRDGELHPVEHPAGAMIDGELARIALAAGWARPEGDPPPPSQPEPKPRGRRR